MFRCLLHHLQGDNCVISSRTVSSLQCCSICCATEHEIYPSFNLQCLLQCLKQHVVRSCVSLESEMSVKILFQEPADINPLNTKRRPLYLKIQFVPRSKHFPSRL